MYILASDILGKPILSLQNGQKVALVSSLMIDPDTLDLVALMCDEGHWRKTPHAVLMIRDIRDIMRDGVVIDSFEDIENIDEIVRLKTLVERKFELKGVGVVTESKQKLGTVEDYTIDNTSYRVQKLYLKQSMFKNLLLNNLIVDRNQIVDVTPKLITVRDASVEAPNLARGAAGVPSKPA